MRIILKGRIPSKKNSRNIFVVKGRLLNIPSKQYEAWHEEKSWELKMRKFEKLEKVESIEITIFAPDKRKSDLTNKVESLMDLMVDNGILEDDNWFVCGDIRLKFGGVDKENPRAEIIIN